VNCNLTPRNLARPGWLLFGFVMALTATAQTAIAQAPDVRPADQKPNPDVYQTIYLANVSDQQSINDIQTDLRSMLPRDKFFAVQSQNAISFRGAADDLTQARKIVSDLDRPRKAYRLTYKITESDGGQTKETQHITVIVVPGSRTILKQGTRVPIVTGSTHEGGSTQDQVQYQDVGMSITASLGADANALVLQTRVEASSLANPASDAGARDPNIHQAVWDGVSALALGKPLVLGSLDIPGTSRHEEFEVVAELVQ
jgi:type II secretory pathway component GspD/PulD (secretin)